MELSPARFVSIEGTDVRLTINNDQEAKIALKELKQKRKELALIKRKFQSQQKMMRQKHTAQSRKLAGFTLVNSISRLMGLGGGIGKIGTAARAVQRLNLVSELSPVEMQHQDVEVAILNVDAAILHVTGKYSK